MARIRLTGTVEGAPGELFGAAHLFVPVGKNQEGRYGQELRLRTQQGTVRVGLAQAHVLPATVHRAPWSTLAGDPAGAPFRLSGDPKVRLTVAAVVAGDVVTVVGEPTDEGFVEGSGGPREAPRRAVTAVRALVVTSGPDHDRLADEVAGVVLESGCWFGRQRWPGALAYFLAVLGTAAWAVAAVAPPPGGRLAVVCFAEALFATAAFRAVVTAQRRFTGSWGFYWVRLDPPATLLGWIAAVTGFGLALVGPIAAIGVLGGSGTFPHGLAVAYAGSTALGAAFLFVLARAGTRNVRKILEAFRAAPFEGGAHDDGATRAVAGTIGARRPSTPLYETDLVSDWTIVLETATGAITLRGPFDWASTVWREHLRIRGKSHVMSVPVGARAVAAGRPARQGDGTWVLGGLQPGLPCLYATMGAERPGTLVARHRAALRGALAASLFMAIVLGVTFLVAVGWLLLR